jgi:hypothetical protein
MIRSSLSASNGSRAFWIQGGFIDHAALRLEVHMQAQMQIQGLLTRGLQLFQP